VDVYNCGNFVLKREISIQNSTSLWAIVACQSNNCLYIGDAGQKVVHRYELGNEGVSLMWAVGGVCHSMSVTKTNSVVITLRDAKLIREYTTEGVLIREIRLDTSIEGPQHSVQLSNGLFAVSHDTYGQLVVSHGGAEKHRVCLVDIAGCIVKSYGECPGSGVGQIDGPRQIVVDAHDNVLVVDHYGNRVILLSPTLEHLGYISIPGHELSVPQALHLDELNHRLYIGEWAAGGRLFVLTADVTKLRRANIRPL